MGKLDQKQKIQVVVLGALAAVMFGTFIFRMIQVTPAAAKTQTASTDQTSTTSASSSKTKFTATAADDALVADAPPPTSTMRDPFVPAFADQSAIQAYQKSVDPAKPAAQQTSGSWNKMVPPLVAPLPRPGDLSMPASLTVAPLPKPVAQTVADPTWTVTGVVDGDDGRMAILRSGDSRRMVRMGDMVDDTYRVVDVDEGHVTLAHGKSKFKLDVGARPAAPAPSAPSTQTTPASTPQALGAPDNDGDDDSSTGTPANPNAVIKLPGGLTLPTVRLPGN